METHKRGRLHILVKPSKVNSCTGIQIQRGGRDVPKHINGDLYPQRAQQSPFFFDGCLMLFALDVWMLCLVICCGFINLSAI